MTKRNKSLVGGSYSAPRGTFTVQVPLRWHMRDSGAELQITSENTKTAVTVSSYKRVRGAPPIDAGRRLERFLLKERVKRSVKQSKKRYASASYSKGGSRWHVVFKENDRNLLLATANTDQNDGRRDFSLAVKIIDTIRWS